MGRSFTNCNGVLKLLCICELNVLDFPLTNAIPTMSGDCTVNCCAEHTLQVTVLMRAIERDKHTSRAICEQALLCTATIHTPAL